MRNSLLALALIAAVVGCGGKPRVHRPGEEWLAEIRVEGNTALESDDLVPGLALKRNLDAGRALDPYQLTVDRDRLRAAYVNLGYFEVTVTPRVDLVGAEQHVVFVIVEGPRSKLEVVIQGLPPEVPAAKARALIAAKDGAPYEYEVYDAAKQPMFSLVQNAGYPHVAIDWAVIVDRTRGVAVARFAIEPGQRATFGEFTVFGTDGDLEAAIKGRLAFRPGDVFSATALADTQKAIYELGRFSTVRMEPDLTAGAVVPGRISVSLTDRHEIKVGGGVGYDPVNFELRVRIGGTYVNAAHPLWTFGADLRPAVTFTHNIGNLSENLKNPLTKVRALVTAQRMELFRPRWRGELELSADYLTVEAYTSKGPRFRAGLSLPLGVPWLQLRGGWLIEYLLFTSPKVLEPTLTELRLNENQRRGAYELSIAADLRDNALDPHSGVYAQVRASIGTFLAGSDIDYRQITPELRGFVPFPAGIVLALRGRFGAIFGEVPVTERYFAGGANSQRGFPDRRLSPEAATKDGAVVIGGAALVETGAELRIPFVRTGKVPFGIEVFLDGGDVTNQPKELDLVNLHWATGVGVWLKIGGESGVKVRVDLGYRLNRTGPGEPQAGENFPIHIGVGDTF